MEYERAYASLAAVLLEDSWVLEIAPHDRGIAFHLEAVLTPQHPDYQSPQPGEQHCYRTAWLTIDSNSNLDLALSGVLPATDASGGTDLGHIDVFRHIGGGTWQLDGDWGSVVVSGPEVNLTFE